MIPSDRLAFMIAIAASLGATLRIGYMYLQGRFHLLPKTRISDLRQNVLEGLLLCVIIALSQAVMWRVSGSAAFLPGMIIGAAVAIAAAYVLLALRGQR